MRLKIIAYTLCLLFLGANIVLYYYQRHRFIEIITAWKKQDETIAHKAWLYDVEQERKRREKAQPTEMELIQQAIQGYCGNLQPAITDSNGITIYYRP